MIQKKQGQENKDQKQGQALIQKKQGQEKQGQETRKGIDSGKTRTSTTSAQQGHKHNKDKHNKDKHNKDIAQQGHALIQHKDIKTKTDIKTTQPQETRKRGKQGQALISQLKTKTGIGSLVWIHPLRLCLTHGLISNGHADHTRCRKMNEPGGFAPVTGRFAGCCGRLRARVAGQAESRLSIVLSILSILADMRIPVSSSDGPALKGLCAP